MYLTDALNKHVVPFQDYKGPISLVVPVIGDGGRIFAGGDIVLKETRDALASGDDGRIQAWGLNYFNLADACFCFEDSVKFQPNSGFLTGIRGIVEVQDSSYVAIDAEAVKSSVLQDGRKYFKVNDSETVKYGLRKQEQRERVENVVLFPYDEHSMKFTPDQFKAIAVGGIRRETMIHTRDMEIEEIIQDGDVVHPVWGIYPSDVVVPLVREVFGFTKREYGSNANMGIWLPSEPQEQAEMRALSTSGLDDGYRLLGVHFGFDYGRLVGVHKFECSAQK